MYRTSLLGRRSVTGCSSLNKRVIAGCLRNAREVADTLRDSGWSGAVVAAGERWPDGTLRPALEDLIGAGAILSYLNEADMSPQAKVAVAAFRSVAANLQSTLMDCVSGRELVERGLSADVRIAGCLNEGAVVPMLVDGAYSV